MEIQIRKALEQIVNSFEVENSQFYKHLVSSLQLILTVLSQEQQAMRDHHRKQIEKLKDIINEKQFQIEKLKNENQKSIRKNENIVCNQTTATPYKILLKSGKNHLNHNHNVNKQNIHRDPDNQLDQAFSGINISDKKQYRFSLQIGASGVGRMAAKQVSSGIKNKIINQKSDRKLREVLSPRQFGHQSQQTRGQFQESKIRPVRGPKQMKATDDTIQSRIFSHRQRQQFVKMLQGDGNKNQVVCGPIQQKTKLCRKPSNKSKRQLLKKREVSSSNCQTTRVRCVDVTIPIKTISVSSLKPR